jgi:hypothetical protein
MDLGSNWKNISVAGVTHYQDALWALTGLDRAEAEAAGEPIGVEAVAELEPEPGNPHDPRAVKVLIEGSHVGYLSRRHARRYRRQIRAKREAGEPVLVDAFIRGLWRPVDSSTLGITLQLPVSEEGEVLIEPGGRGIARRVVAEREERS